MLDVLSRDRSPSGVDLPRLERDGSWANDRRRQDLADPFQARWRLRVVPLGVVIWLSCWLVTITLMG